CFQRCELSSTSYTRSKAHRPRSTPRTTRLYELAKEKTQGLRALEIQNPTFSGPLEYSFLRFLREGTISVEGAEKPLSRREMSCAIPPLVFLEKISCLAMIMGESRDSGQGLGFDPRAS